MKKLFHRAVSALRPVRKPMPDLEAAAPLVHLLEEAEPSDDMFARIEAQIEGDTAPATRTRPVLAPLVFVLGLGIGGLVSHWAVDRQQIVARPAADAAWVPLGSVRLQGRELRGFVRARCQGHTHFFITMHGHSPSDPEQDAVPLMGPDEKILMECIF